MKAILPELERAHLAHVVTGERHRQSASFLPLTNDRDRILNANGEEVARCESNHSAMVLVLLANAGAGLVFEEVEKP